MYPPGMLAIYLLLHGPFIIFGGKFSLIGIYISNRALAFISIRLIYLRLWNFQLNTKLALISTTILASSPLFLFEGIYRATNDLAPITLSLVGIYFISKDRKLLAYFFLLWATFTKCYP